MGDVFVKLSIDASIELYCFFFLSFLFLYTYLCPLQHGGKPWVADPEHWNYRAAAKATQAVYKVEPDLTREGGSIPVTLSFAEALGVNVLLLPMGRGDDGQFFSSSFDLPRDSLRDKKSVTLLFCPSQVLTRLTRSSTRATTSTVSRCWVPICTRWLLSRNSDGCCQIPPG